MCEHWSRLAKRFKCHIIGTRQGCMLNPLFIIYLNELVTFCNKYCLGIYVNEEFENLNILLYVDDMVHCRDIMISKLEKQLHVFKIHLIFGFHNFPVSFLVFLCHGYLFKRRMCAYVEISNLQHYTEVYKWIIKNISLLIQINHVKCLQKFCLNHFSLIQNRKYIQSIWFEW